MPSREKYTNATPTTLNGSLTSGATSVVLTDASTFPAGGFRIVVESEIMYCSSSSSNTLTVVRGAEGTTAASHASGVAATHVITAGALDAFRIDLLGAMGIIDTTDSLSTDDDNFDDENFTGWTTVQTTPNMTLTEKNHRASIKIPAGTASAQHYAFMKSKTPSNGDWVQAAWQIGQCGNYAIPGVMMADGTTYGSDNQVQFGFSPDEGQFFIRTLTGYNTYSGSQFGSGSMTPYFWPIIHMRLVLVTANHYTGLASPDGISWATVFNNVSLGSMTVSKMGFATTAWGATLEQAHSCSYCRFSF